MKVELNKRDPEETILRLSLRVVDLEKALLKVLANYNIAKERADSADRSVGSQWQNVKFVVDRALSKGTLDDG